MTDLKKERSCCGCAHYNCFDDGDNRWDIWCSLDHDIEDGTKNIAPICSDYKVSV